MDFYLLWTTVAVAAIGGGFLLWLVPLRALKWLLLLLWMAMPLAVALVAASAGGCVQAATAERCFGYGFAFALIFFATPFWAIGVGLGAVLSHFFKRRRRARADN